MTTEVLVVKQDFTPLDLLLWRHYRVQVPLLVEQTLAKNPGLAALGAYLPVGTKVVVDRPVPLKKKTKRSTVKLYT